MFKKEQKVRVQLLHFMYIFMNEDFIVDVILKYVVLT